MIEAYVYSSCTSCRKTVEQLQKTGAPFESRDFFRQRFSRSELESVLARAGLKPSDIVSTRSKAYMALDLASRELSENDLLELFLQEPRLLKRPLVIGNGQAVVGHNESRLAELITNAQLERTYIIDGQ